MDAGGSSSRLARLSARQEMEEVDPYSQSNQWIEAAEYHRLSQLVAAEKEAEARAAAAVPAFVHTKQTWQTPLHVPLPKRKVAQMALPEGLKPMAPPSNNVARPSQRTRRLQEHGQTSEQRASLEKLKDDNQELYAKLVARFRQRTPATGSPVKVGSLASVHCIEDAVLYFLCEKHRRNVLYFSVADPARGRPYDLTPATSGKGEHYLMSSKHLVHLKPQEPAECIPIAEWVYHSRMFDHLLRSIPLFQQLLRRRMFMHWTHYVRQRIYRSTRLTLLGQLHCGRPIYASALREIQTLSHRIQSQRALSLGVTKPSVSLAEWRSAQTTQFKELEAQLTDVRAGAHHALSNLVAAIRSAMTPDTTLAALNAADMFEMRQAYPGWKSIPMAHLKAVTRDQARQVQQAQKDLVAFPAFLRLTQYIFVESLYVMVMASVTHLAAQLTQKAPSRSLTVAVSFLQDAHVHLTPSDADVLRFLHSSIESLTTLSSGFASSRSAAAYLKSDEVVDPPSPPPRLPDVLHADTAFTCLVVALEGSVRDTFARVSQQVEQFNGLRPIYTAMLALTLPTVDDSTYLAQLPTLLSAIANQVGQLDAWQSQCHRIQASWDVGFVDVHCRHVLSEVLERIMAQRAMALDVLCDLTSRGVTHCMTHLKDAIVLFDERPQLISGFCQQKRQTRVVLEAEMTLVCDMRQVDDAFSTLKSLAPPMAAALQSAYNSIHATYAKYNVSLQANLKFAKSMLPQIAKQIVTVLQRYTVQCKKLLGALEAIGTYVHSPVGNLDFEPKQFVLQEIKAELDKIQEASDQYCDYQSIMGMKVTPVALLEATTSLYAEVHEVWDLSYAWKRAYAAMLQAKFVSQRWASHVETTRAFQERTQQVHCRFENRIFASVQAEIATVLTQLPLLVELGAEYIKASHWTQIFKVLDTTSLHVPSMTLQQLDDALVWRHAEKLSQIAYHARIDAETEATLEAMKARWAVTELPCADTELDPLVVGDLLLALDDDLVQVLALLQRTSQPSLYESLSVWSDEINYMQDTLELWLSTQTDWLQLDRLFALPDVQANVRHANVEFQAVSRKWRGMMKGVRSTTSLQQCVREVTNRAFLTETKQLFERLWKQLAYFLQDKRRAFPRLNFVSDRQLLAIMAGTTESLRDPSDGRCRHVSSLLGICFEHIVDATVKVRVITIGSLLGSTLSAAEFPTDLASVASVASLEVPDVERYAMDIVDVGGKLDEVLSLESPITVTQRPEVWLQDLQKALHRSLRDCVRDVVSEDASSAVLQLYIDGDNRAEMARAIKHMEQVVAKLPLQVLLLAFRIYFTGDCSQVLSGDASYALVLQQQLYRATEWVTALKAATTDKQRHACSTMSLCCFNHAELLRRLHGTPHAAFEWSQQRQYRWAHDSQTVNVTHGLKTYEYGFEYLGPHATIALTPLTERIMWSVSMAFRLHAGGLVHGETGVSKQAAIRELVASLGSLLVTYDCSIQLSETQFHRVLSGLMPCQAYALIVGLGAVDDTSAIDRFLHELRRLQHALKTHKDKILLESSHVALHSHDRSSVNFGIVCKLTLSTPAITPLVEHCSRAFLPITASFEMLDALLLARLYLSAAGFLQVDSLSATLHAFLLTSEAGGDRVTVRTIKKITDLAKAYVGDSIDEGHAVAWAIQRVMGPRVAPSFKRTFLQQLRERFPTYRDVELDITKTQARIQDAIAAAHLVLTPILSRKVRELHHLCGHHAVNIITGAVGTGKSTIVQVLATVRRTYGESEAWEQAHCYRIASATLRTTEFYGHFAPETNEWVDGIVTRFVHLVSAPEARPPGAIPWLIFDGDVANACIEPLYAISDETPHVHLPNGERLDTSCIKLFFEASTLELWSPAALNRFGVLSVPSDAVPYTVYVKAWLLRQSSPSLSSRHVDAAKGCAQLLRSHLPSLLQVGRQHWQAHVPFHAPTLVQKLLEIVDSFFHDAPSVAKDVVLIYLVACAWSIGAYIDVDARAIFHDALLTIAPELARHRLFASGRTIYDVCLENDKGKVALVTWQSQMPRMDWASLSHHRFVFVPNETTLRTEHLLEFFGSTRRHALLLGAQGVGKSASAQRSLWQLEKRGCVVSRLYMKPSMSAHQFQACNPPLRSTPMECERVVVDLERKMKGLYGPPTGKAALVYLVEDLHLGSLTSHEQLRQVLDTNSIYDRRTFDLMQLQHCAFLALLSVPTTSSLSLRLLRHFHVVWQPAVPPHTLHRVFRPLATYMAEHFSTKYTAEMAWRALQLPLQVLDLLVQEPLDVPFARFSLGDLVLVYSHVLRASGSNFDAQRHLEGLVFNLTSVVFGSRCTRSDGNFFRKLIPSVATTLDYDLVSYVDQPLYGDKTDGLGYIPLPSREAIGLFIKGHEKFQWHHPTLESPLIKHLAPFPEAIEAMLAMLFALGDLRQHLLLLGPRGVGKRTSLVVVCGILSYNYVEIRRGHDVETRLREVLVQVGTHGKHTVLYIAMDELDASSTRLVLTLVRDGDVPLHVYSAENMDAIADGMAQLPSLANTNPSKAQCLSLYRAHLSTYLHVALSTRTEAGLTTLLAQTSGLLDACTLRVFPAWSALAFSAIYESINVLPTLQPAVWGIHAAYMELRPLTSASRNPASQFKTFVLGLSSYHVERTKTIHDTRVSYSHGLKMMQQHTSAIKAMSSSERILAKKLRTLETKSEQLQARYDKLVTAENQARAVLDAKNEAYTRMKQQLDHERLLIQSELDQTVPELQTAIQSLSRINKLHITEMKSFTSPPDLVRLVMQAVCVLLGLGAAPTWEDALFVLCDMKFLDRLRSFDKDNIPDAVMKKLERVIQHPKFTEDEMKRASIASTSLCRWVLALARYHRVMTIVRPKQNTLDAAEHNLDRVQREVDVVRATWTTHVTAANQVQLAWHENEALRGILQHEYDEVVARLESLERINIAFESLKTILRKENHRIQALDHASLGDSVLLTAISSYIGDVPPSDRTELVTRWKQVLTDAGVAFSDNLLAAMMGDGGLQELRATCPIADAGIAMNLFYLQRWKESPKLQHFLLVDPHGVAAQWIKTVEWLSIEAVSADDPMLLARFEMSPPNSNYILVVDRVAQCNEGSLWAFLQLLQLKKLRHPVYFVADCNCSAQWSTEASPIALSLATYDLMLQEAFTTISFELRTTDLEAHIVSGFFTHFFPADDNQLRLLHEALHDDLRHRAVALDGLLRQLSNPALLVSNDEIATLSGQMDALTMLSRSIRAKEESIAVLEAARNAFLPLGRRGRALLDATAAFGGSVQAFCVLEDSIKQLTDVDGGSAVDDVAHEVTVAYLQTVLHGLPEHQHVAFTFFVALAIAAAEPGGDDLVPLCWHELQRKTHLCVPGIHLPIDVFVASPTITHQVATDVVHMAVRHCVAKRLSALDRHRQHALTMTSVLSGDARYVFRKDGGRHPREITRLLRNVQSLLALPLFAPLLDDIDAHTAAYTTYMQATPRFFQDMPWTRFMQQLPAVAKLLFIVLSHDLIVPNMMQQVVNAYVPEINYELLTVPVMVHITDGHRPILLQFEPHSVVHPLWVLIETALSLGIRDADIWYFSLAVPDVIPACLRALKDASVHGGWLILQDVALLSAGDLMDLNRQFSLLSNGDLSIHSDFRLWLVDEAPSSLLARLPSAKLHTFYFNAVFTLQNPLEASVPPIRHALHLFHGIALSGAHGVHVASPFYAPVTLYELEKAEYLLECLGDKHGLSSDQVASLIARLYHGKSLDPSVEKQWSALARYIMELGASSSESRPGEQSPWLSRLKGGLRHHATTRGNKEGMRRSCDVLLPVDTKISAAIMGLPHALDGFFETQTMLAVASTLTQSKAPHRDCKPQSGATPVNDLAEALVLQLPRDSVFTHCDARSSFGDRKWHSRLHKTMYTELVAMEIYFGQLQRDLRTLSQETASAIARQRVPPSWLRAGYACPTTLVRYVAWAQSAASFYLEFLHTQILPALQLQFVADARAVLFTLLATYAKATGTDVSELCLAVVHPATPSSTSLRNLFVRNARWDAAKQALCELATDDWLIQGSLSLQIAACPRTDVRGYFACPIYPYYATNRGNPPSGSSLVQLYFPTAEETTLLEAKGVVIVLNEAE